MKGGAVVESSQGASNAAPTQLRIGLASVRNAPTVAERLETLDRTLAQAASQQVAIVCFPEVYLPGLRGMDFPVPAHDQQAQEAALAAVRASAARHGVAVVIGMEWAPAGHAGDGDSGLLNLNFVINRDGSVQGGQTKNQIPPVEEPHYIGGHERRLFEIDGVPFAITVCHEGWRYPESVRWSAARGAQVIFHPQLTGSDTSGPILTRWGDPDAPYYEKAMLARSVENTIYFASVNYAFRYQEAATSVLGPEGQLVAHAPYGEEHLLVVDLDLTQATGYYARRYNPDLYPATP